LVFTTVHANNVLTSSGRFITYGRRTLQLVSALNCIMAQRLVRIICPNCKRAKEAHAGGNSGNGAETEDLRDSQISEGAGCLECSGTGYTGAPQSANCWTFPTGSAR